jgi:hypothetical protein
LEEIESNSPKKDKMLQSFRPFLIEFNEPQLYRINCTKLVDFDLEKSLYIYRGIDMRTNELCDVYEWKICLEKNCIFDKKKSDLCFSKVNEYLS